MSTTAQLPENADSERAESIGIPVALIVLLLALGSVVAALLPLLLAVPFVTAANYARELAFEKKWSRALLQTRAIQPESVAEMA